MSTTAETTATEIVITGVYTLDQARAIAARYDAFRAQLSELTFAAALAHRDHDPDEADEYEALIAALHEEFADVAGF